MSRKELLVSELKSLLGDLAGQDLGPSDPSANFIDLGFDSLFLTQAAMLMKNKFGVKVTFRSLLEDLTSISALAAHLDSQMPAGKQVGSQPPVAAAPQTSAPPRNSTPTPALAQPSPQQPSFASTPSPSVPDSSSGASLTSTALDRVIKEQLRIMEQQLSLLRRSTPAPFQVPLAPADQALAPVPAPPPSEAKTSGAAPSATSPSPSAAAVAPAPMAQHGPFRQLDKGQRGGLSEQQQAHLDWLIPRYVAKSPKSKEYTQRYRASFSDPRAVAGFKQNWKEMVYPIVSTRSAGANLWDLDENKWVDVTMGFGVALLGHSPQFITEAVRKQLDLGVEIGPQSPLAGEVAELICEFTGMDRVTFCNTGSEAVMAALRICRTVTGRTKVVVFAGAYHGTFDEVLVKGAWVNGEPKTLAIAPGVAPNLISSVVVLEYGTQQTLDWIRKNSEDLAAVLVETVQSRHPDLQPKEFLQEIRKITLATETPLIFDEVITGFRCHPGGAQKYFGIEADLATYGKIIGGGMPFGFIAGKAYLMDAFDGGTWQYGDDSFPPTGVTFFAGTFVRHPLAMAAAKAMLLRLKAEGPALQEGLGKRTDRMLGELNSYFEKHQVPLHLEHFTSVWYPHFGAEVKYGSLLYFHLREKGLHIWEGRPCFLSTAEDEAFIIRAFKLSVAEMQAGGFLPGTSAPEFMNEATKRRGLCAESAGASVSPLQLETRSSSSSQAATESGATHSNRIPLTEGQKEMWFSALMEPQASGAFNASAVIELDGPLQRDALNQAVQHVVDRHQALRATFSEDGQWIEIGATRPIEVVTHDIAPLATPARNAKLAELIGIEGARLFDLIKGPLFSFALVRTAPERHTLVFTVNMIVCDGWGYNVILEEVGAAYSAAIRGETFIADVAIPLRDYVQWLAQTEQQVLAEESEKFWKNTFRSIPAPLDLPLLGSRPAARTYQGSRQSLKLSADLYRSIKAAAKAQGSTTFALFLATYQTWLHRLTGSTDFVVGVPYAGQSSIGSDVVGQCVHTLPLRFAVNPLEPFSALIRKTRDVVLDAQEHWNCTFGSVAQQLDIPRDPSRLPLVSVIFNLDPPMNRVRFEGLKHHIEAGPRFYFQYDLGFNLVDEGETLVVECDYNAHLFDSTLIGRWLGHYQTLLETVVADAGGAVGLLPMLSAAERKACLIDSKSTPVDLDPAATVHKLISAQCSRTPGDVALEFEGRTLTYAELNRRSTKLANHLRELGAKKGSFVGVCLDRSLDKVVAVLAVLKSGAAYVSIDFRASCERIHELLAEAGVSLVVTESSLQSKLPQSAPRRVVVDADREAIERRSSTLHEEQQEPGLIACLAYSSGSTGKAKAVEITHRALVNLLLAMQRDPGVTRADTLLGITSLSSDFSAVELFLPLTVGARLVIAPLEVTNDAGRFAEIISTSGATVIQATPSTWRRLVNAGWKGSNKLKLLSGGERLAADLAERLLLCSGGLWNLYGSVECAIWSSISRVKAGSPVTLGKPIANTQMFVLTDLLQPAPVGVVAEIVIGGEGLASGYRSLPELSQTRFIVSPWDAKSRLYRTGDLGRLLPNGDIEFLGRSEFEIRILGCKIEPQEIETVLLSHPQVSEAVVVSRELIPGEISLGAFIAVSAMVGTHKAQPSSSELVQELRRLVKSKLPDYMLPASFVVLDQLPRNLNGKIDRYTLLSLSAHAVEPTESFISPRNETEEKLARLWCEILKLKKVSIRDNFFDLGGQSLRAVALFGRLEKEFGRKLPLATLFRAPTIEQLALSLSGGTAQASDAWASLVPIQPKGSGRPLFLVHGAGGNVLLYQALVRYMGPDFPLYGLQSRGLDGVAKPLRTVEQMASLYLKEIREVQPKGPYYIGGYCMGGTIAYEMAQLLRAEGEHVALVAMLDTYNFPLMLKVNPAKYLFQKIRFHLGNFMRLSPGEMIKYVKEKLRVARDGEWANLFGGEGVAEATADSGGSGAAIQASIQAINDRASLTYKPQPYAGKLSLFKPKVNYDFYPDPQMGWGGLVTGGIEIVEMPVNPHAMLVEPYVEALARELKNRVAMSPKFVEVSQTPTSVTKLHLGTQVA